MLGRLFAALFLMATAVGSAAADQPQYVAVLQLRGASHDNNFLSLVTDEVRAGVLDATKGSPLSVMSRENITVILQDMGLDPSCVEGECEVETGRNIGAAYVVSGEVVTVESRVHLALKLHATSQGTLVASKRVDGATAGALIDEAAAAGTALMREGGVGGEALAAASAQSTPAAGADALKAQRCQTQAVLTGQAQRAKRLERERQRIQAESRVSWEKLRPMVDECLTLDEDSRKPCIRAVENWIVQSAKLVATIQGGQEAVDTECGPQRPAFESQTDDVQAPDMSVARAMLRRLRQAPKPTAEDPDVEAGLVAADGGIWDTVRPDLDELYAMLVWYGVGSAEFAQGSGSMSDMRRLNPSSGLFFEACGRYNLGPLYGPAVHMIVGGRSSDKGAPLFGLPDDASTGNSGWWGDFGLSAGVIYPNRWFRPFAGYRASASYLSAKPFSGGKKSEFFYVPHGIEAGLEVGPGAGLRVQFFRSMDGTVERQHISAAVFFPGAM